MKRMSNDELYEAVVAIKDPYKANYQIKCVASETNVPHNAYSNDSYAHLPLIGEPKLNKFDPRWITEEQRQAHKLKANQEPFIVMHAGKPTQFYNVSMLADFSEPYQRPQPTVELHPAMEKFLNDTNAPTYHNLFNHSGYVSIDSGEIYMADLAQFQRQCDLYYVRSNLTSFLARMNMDKERYTQLFFGKKIMDRKLIQVQEKITLALTSVYFCAHFCIKVPKKSYLAYINRAIRGFNHDEALKTKLTHQYRSRLASKYSDINELNHEVNKCVDQEMLHINEVITKQILNYSVWQAYNTFDYMMRPDVSFALPANDELLQKVQQNTQKEEFRRRKEQIEKDPLWEIKPKRASKK